MRRTEINDWLQQNQGQKDYKESWVEVPNPRYNPSDPYNGQPQKIREKHVQWTANNGQVLEVIDRSDQVTDMDPNTGRRPNDRDLPGQDPNDPTAGRDPDYDLVRKGDPDNTDTRSPEVKAGQQATHAEAEWNRANGPVPDTTSPAYDPNAAGRGSGIYETHTARETRERQAETARQQDEDRSRRTRTDERQAESEAARVANDAARVEIERGRAQVEAERSASQAQTAAQQADASSQQAATGAAAEARAARTPGVIGTPKYDDPNISYVDPSTGEIKQTANPGYDEIRTQADRKREEIKQNIESGRFSLEQGAAEYKRWFDENIGTPIALATERRAQAKEKREALDAEDRRRLQKSQNEIERARVGQQAAETASANERSLLPYRVGSGFSKNYADAVNGLAAGGVIGGPSASAGVHFGANDFSFSAPDFKSTAKNATKEALKHLTPYDPDMTPQPVADYSNIAPPNYTPPPAMPTLPTIPTYTYGGQDTP